jgi:hypothetical protein
MALLAREELNRLVGQAYKSAAFTDSLKKSVIAEKQEPRQSYDVFLSHSYLDREPVLQVNYLLEDVLGFDVFVDWIEMPDLDRSAVNQDTAATLRDVMNRCATLVYAVSVISSTSKWMPWELGYSDARHGRVAVLPIADVATTYAAYRDQEFVGLYPYIDIENDDDGKRHLWVNSPVDSKTYAKLQHWRQTGRLTYHP